jgi:hypothetical protein
MNMKQKEQERTTDICYAHKITRNKYLSIFLSVLTVSFTIIIFCHRLFILQTSLPRGICVYIISINRIRLRRRRPSSKKILYLVALSFLLSIAIVITVFPTFDRGIQLPLAHAQQETNNNGYIDCVLKFNNTKSI